jgi:Flp pilus assembly protein TadG
MWKIIAKTKPDAELNFFSAAVKQFAKDEDGALTIFGLYMLIVMIMVGGIATDIMRHDAIQSQLQGTADRAALAAADLDQTLDGKAVVADYFAKANLTEFLKTPVVVQGGLNWREVTVEANVNMQTYFMGWSGVKTLPVQVKSIATERVTDIEISLVVDVSGSMNNNNRLTNLKTAANSFFDSVIKNTVDPNLGMTSVSIIPYNQGVNVGPTILKHYTPSTAHDESQCIRFTSNQFNSRGLSTTNTINRLAHFAWGSNNFNPIPFGWWECVPDPKIHIMPFSMDKAKLKAKINGLYGNGNTAVDVGMKWGSIMLDPSVRPVIDKLVTENVPGSTTEKVVNSHFSGRPVSYTNQENMKVIVLMTDGVNTRQYDLKNTYKFNNSPIYYSPSYDEYMVRIGSNPSNKRWYYPNEPETVYWNGSREPDNGEFRNFKRSDAIRLKYHDVYKLYAIDDVAHHFFLDAGDTNLYDKHKNARTTITDNENDGKADANLNRICNAVKLKNTVIFTIAFEAPTDAEKEMRKCASSDGHYFDVDGTDINTAFRSIASQINQLRLSQ